MIELLVIVQNWMYVKKNQDSFDPYIYWNIGKWYHNMDLKTEAIESYKLIIKYMADNPEKIDNTIFWESLYALGLLEKERENYSKAMDAFMSFLDFQQKQQLPIPQELIDKIKGEHDSWKEIISEKIKGVK